MANNSVNSSMTRSDVARSENFSRAYIMPATHFSVHGNENAASSLDFNFALRDKARILRMQSIREAAFRSRCLSCVPHHNRGIMKYVILMTNYTE